MLKLAKQLLLTGIFLIPALVFGQTQYKYRYRQHLTSQPSTYTTNTVDTLMQANTGILTFHLFDNTGTAVPMLNITLKNSISDTILQSNADGFAYLELTSGTYSLMLFSLPYTPIVLENYIVSANTHTTITTSLGRSNAMSIALIHSIRELTAAEIQQITDDLSNQKEDIELIKNKTCYVTWEL